MKYSIQHVPMSPNDDSTVISIDEICYGIKLNLICRLKWEDLAVSNNIGESPLITTWNDSVSTASSKCHAWDCLESMEHIIQDIALATTDSTTCICKSTRILVLASP